jgi:hypothetical protein
VSLKAHAKKQVWSMRLRCFACAVSGRVLPSTCIA